MAYKSKLISNRQGERKQSNGTKSVEPYGTTGSMEYRLRCGRTVRLEECYFAASRLGFLAGSEESTRGKVIEQLPARVRAQFAEDHGVLIKPVPEGHLPTYTFMAALTCDHPVCDLSADYSTLVLCWLGDIETPLPELIAKEISRVEWDDHAADSRD